VPSSGTGYFAGTVVTATARGASLTRTGVPRGRMALVVSRGRGFGSVGVFYRGRLVRRVDLASASSRDRVVVALPRMTGSGTVRVEVLTAGRPVRVDGLLSAPSPDGP
jgi:hypothetical protein